MSDDPTIVDFTFSDVSLSDMAPVKRHVFNWDAVIERLKQSSTTIAVDLPEGINANQIRHGITQAGIRRGLSVGTRILGGRIFLNLRKTATPRKQRNPERDSKILEAVEAGETLESIGHRYSLSRQRIEQIANNFTTLPAQERREATLEFLEPYLIHIDRRFCAVCGNEIPLVSGSKRRVSYWLCSSCVELQKVINSIKGNLVSWRNGNEHARLEALWLIRKYNIKPEHLAGAKSG
jgi:Mor family transcriptional regulator